MAFGGALASVFGFSLTHFLVSHFIRTYAVGPAEAAMAFAAVAGVAAAVGMVLGGWLSDRLAQRLPSIQAILPAVAMVGAAPLYFLALQQGTLLGASVLFFAASVIHQMFYAPMFSMAQGAAPQRLRATAAALLLLILTLIGYGAGPPLVGALADYFSQAQFEGEEAISTICSDPATRVEACRQASAQGLSMALRVAVGFLLWAALHFALARRTIVRDQAAGSVG